MAILKFALAMAAFALPVPLHAQASVGQMPAAEQQAVDAALELLDVQDYEALFLATAVQSADEMFMAQLDASAKEGKAAIPEPLVAKLRQLVMAEMKEIAVETMPTIRLRAAQAYARLFSAEELRELAKLQQIPVMKKINRLTPQLTSELGRIGLEATAPRAPELQRKVEEMVVQWFKENEGEGGPET